MPLPKKVALVVDDDSSIRKEIREILEEFEYDIIEAENGREGVQKFQQQKFDLVTMDFIMPELNGAEAVSVIRQLDKNVLIIGLSSSHNRMAAECKRLGFVIPVLSKFEMPEILTSYIKGIDDGGVYDTRSDD